MFGADASAVAAVFTGLSDAQADGMACVVCGTSFTTYPAPPQVPIGFSDTRSQVFACETCLSPPKGRDEPGQAVA